MIIKSCDSPVVEEVSVLAALQPVLTKSESIMIKISTAEDVLLFFTGIPSLFKDKSSVQK